MSRYDSRSHAKGKGRGSMNRESEDTLSVDDEPSGLPSQPRTTHISYEDRSSTRSAMAVPSSNYELNTASSRSSRPALDPRRSSSNEVARTQGIGTNNKVQMGKVAAAFMNIGVSDWKKCAAFVANRPDVLDLDTEPFRQAALQACIGGNSKLAERCLERIVMLQTCEGLSIDDSYTYIRNLGKPGQDQEDFNKRFDAQWAAIENDADVIADSVTDGVDALAIGIHPASGGRRRPSDKETSGSGVRTRRESATQEHGHMAPSLAALQQMGDMQMGAAPQRDPGRSSRQVQSGYNRSAVLDAAFEVQRDIRDFFVIGRVFKILWHQPAGANLDGVVPGAGAATAGIFGEPIHSSLRWMVVVGRKSGHCICCPISTYSQQGLRRNIRAGDVDAHAIVFEHGSQPMSVSGEQRMSKAPIAIELGSGTHSIDPKSRIHFGKFHCVEYNVKVKSIGKVHRDDVQRVLEYSRQEFLNSSLG